MNNLQTVLTEGRLIRRTWADEQDGRQLLCALTALTGDPSTRPVTCPADKAPGWVAHLLPWMDDSGTAERWPEHMRRLAAIADRLPKLGRRAELRTKRVTLLEARKHAGTSLGVVDAVIALLDRAIAGDEPTDAEWAAARAAALAARSAAWAVAGAEAADRIIAAILDVWEKEVA